MSTIAEQTLSEIRSNPNHTPLTFDPSSISVTHTYNHPHGFEMEYTNLLERFIAPLIFPDSDINYTTGYAPTHDFSVGDWKYELKITGDKNQQLFVERGRSDGKDTGLTITEADFYVVLHKTVNNGNDIIKIHVFATDTLKVCGKHAPEISKYHDTPAIGFNVPLGRSGIPSHCWFGDFNTPTDGGWDMTNCWRINTSFGIELQQMQRLLQRNKTPLKSTFKNVVTVKEL